MRHMTKTVLAIVLAGVLGVGPVMAEGDRMTLTEAVATGMLTNPEYGIVANDRRAVDAELSQAKSLYLPSVDLQLDGGFEHTDTPSINDEDLIRRNAFISLRQMLFDGFEARSEVRRQRARVDSAAHRVNETAEFVGFDITEAYLEVLRQRDLLKIAQENVQDHIDLLRLIETGVQGGTATRGDVEQAKARLAAAKANLSNVHRDLKTSEAQYIREVGHVPPFLEFPAVPKDSLSQDVEMEVEEALTNSPTLDIFESDINVARAEWEAASAPMWPRVDLELDAQKGEDVNGLDGDSEGASALAVVRWNLYRGGADIANRREQVYRWAEAKERRADNARAVEEEVRQTWAAMESAAERARQFGEQARANESVVEVYRNQFTLGRRTLLDVLDAQNELFVSRSSQINSLYTELLAMYRLLALKGVLLPTLGVDRPAEARPRLDSPRGMAQN